MQRAPRAHPGAGVAVRKARFHFYQDRSGEWRWRLYAPNNRIVADSGEGYSRKADAKRAAKRVIFHATRAIQ